MCGIIGILAKGPVNQPFTTACWCCSIAARTPPASSPATAGKSTCARTTAWCATCSSTRHMHALHGNMGIGHVRYPTAGCDSPAEAQPFYVNSPFGMALAHNGNLTNADELKDELFREDLRHINTESDSEILLNVFAHELQAVGQAAHSTPRHCSGAVAAVHRRCRGAYAVVVHDRRASASWRSAIPTASARWCTAGARPTRAPSTCSPRRAWRSTCWASSWCATSRPGEAVFIDRERPAAHPAVRRPAACMSPCIFEYVYLARPGLDHRRHLGPQDAPAHGREAGRQDPARSGRTTTSTW